MSDYQRLRGLILTAINDLVHDIQLALEKQMSADVRALLERCYSVFMQLGQDAKGTEPTKAHEQT